MHPVPRPRIVLLGGSFNPPHVGHLRIALEVRDILAPRTVVFIPCASPPHKSREQLLPFPLRFAMLEKVTCGLSGFEVSAVEAERPGPSYTVDTLRLLASRHKRERLAFILGGDDFLQLSGWRDWRRIPELADLIVLPRNEETDEPFLRTLRASWPDAVTQPSPAPEVRHAFLLPHGGRILYLPRPRLEVSSSLVRSYWVEGRSLDFLVPPEICVLLDRHRDSILPLWRN